MKENKSAKEMFEELGYRFEETEDIKGNIMKWNYHYIKFDGNFKWQIHFNNSTKFIFMYCKLFNKTIPFICITKELLQAINKQIEELEW